MSFLTVKFAEVLWSGESSSVLHTNDDTVGSEIFEQVLFATKAKAEIEENFKAKEKGKRTLKDIFDQ